jgi:hypothetical protein
VTTRLEAVWEWWRIGLSIGLGASAGIALVGVLGPSRAAAVGGVLAAAAAGVGIGVAVDDWDDVVAAVAGGVVGALSTVQVVGGAVRRGGTRGGTAMLVALGAVVVAGLAFVPAVGFVEGAGLPLLAMRLRRRAPRRYAGLRTLARD